MIGKLNHVAIVVPDLAAAAAQYRDLLGGTVSAAHDLPDHGVTTVLSSCPTPRSSCSILWATTALSTGFSRRTLRAGFTMFAMRWMTSSRRVIILSQRERGCLAQASRRLAHMESLCSFSIRKISMAVLLSLSKSDSSALKT